MVVFNPFVKKRIAPEIRERIGNEWWKTLIDRTVVAIYRQKNVAFCRWREQRRNLWNSAFQCGVKHKICTSRGRIPHKASDFHPPQIYFNIGHGYVVGLLFLTRCFFCLSSYIYGDSGNSGSSASQFSPRPITFNSLSKVLNEMSVIFPDSNLYKVVMQTEADSDISLRVIRKRRR